MKMTRDARKNIRPSQPNVNNATLYSIWLVSHFPAVYFLPLLKTTRHVATSCTGAIFRRRNFVQMQLSLCNSPIKCDSADTAQAAIVGCSASKSVRPTQQLKL